MTPSAPGLACSPGRRSRGEHSTTSIAELGVHSGINDAQLSTTHHRRALPYTPSLDGITTDTSRYSGGLYGMAYQFVCCLTRNTNLHRPNPHMHHDCGVCIKMVVLDPSNASPFCFLMYRLRQGIQPSLTYRFNPPTPSTDALIFPVPPLPLSCHQSIVTHLHTKR